MIVDLDDKACPCCGHALHRIGEDVSERLDIIPAQFRVVLVRRPKYACRACEEAVVQAAAPARLIEGGLPTEALVAQVPREAEAGPLQGDEGPFGGPRIVPWYMKISHAAGVTFKEPLAAVERLEGAGPHVANLVPAPTPAPYLTSMSATLLTPTPCGRRGGGRRPR